MFILLNWYGVTLHCVILYTGTVFCMKQHQLYNPFTVCFFSFKKNILFKARTVHIEYVMNRGKYT